MSLVCLEARPDLVERVYDALVDAISSGELLAGERITQEDIAARLAVSRQPVLQAFRLLRKEGLLRDAPGRGLQVAPLDPAAITQVYQVRGALDVLAAGLAARQKRALAPALLADGRAAARRTDVAAMIAADCAFHQAIYEASGNPMIAQTACLHWCHLRRAMGAVLQDRSARASVWDEHEAIAAAIAAGDVAAAQRLSSAHAETASRHIVQALMDGANPGPARAPARAPARE